MVQITQPSDVQTVILTYEVPSGSCEPIVALLSETYEGFITHQPGFVGAAIHVNDARTRVASYSQWGSRDAFLAVLRSDQMQDVNRRLTEMSKSFAPVLYEVAHVFEPAP